MCVHCKEHNQKTNRKFLSRQKKSQVQLLAIFVFLVLVPTVIIAQNATNTSISPSAEGGIITANDSVQPIPSIPSAEANQTPAGGSGAESPENQSESRENTTESWLPQPEENATSDLPGNETDTISNQTIPENQTLPMNATENVTYPENQTLPEENVTENITAEPPENETNIPENQTLPENCTQPTNETQPPGPPEPPEEPETYALLSVRIESPDRFVRGENTTISAVISNTGTAPATNLSLKWFLPGGLALQELSNPCETIPPGGQCTATAKVLTLRGSVLGNKEIRVLVNYNE